MRKDILAGLVVWIGMSVLIIIYILLYSSSHW